MPIGISDVVAYRSISPVWVITWAPFGSYSALLSLSYIVMYLQVLIIMFPVIHFIERYRHKASVIKTKKYI